MDKREAKENEEEERKGGPAGAGHSSNALTRALNTGPEEAKSSFLSSVEKFQSGAFQDATNFLIMFAFYFC